MKKLLYILIISLFVVNGWAQTNNINKPYEYDDLSSGR